MTTRILNGRSRLQAGILFLLFVFAAGQGGIDEITPTAHAQLSTSPTGTEGFNPRGTVSPSGGQGGAPLHPAYTGAAGTMGAPTGNPSEMGQGGGPQSGFPTGGAGQGGNPLASDTGGQYPTQNPTQSPSQNPAFMQGAADQQPTLAPGGRQTQAGAGQGGDGMSALKSVPYAAHPINDYLTKVKRSAGAERPEKETYLYEVLAGVTSASQRRELIRAYWDLSEKMLKCHVRLGQRQRLELAYKQLQSNEAAKTEIELAFQLVSQQYRALELEFVQAQYHFADLQAKYAPARSWRSGYAYDAANCEISSPTISSNRTITDSTANGAGDQPLPIPAEFPLAVPYDTKVKELREFRTLSQKSLLLSRTIPLQYETVVARTAAKNHADNLWYKTLTFGQSPVSQIETLAREEADLIAAIIEYNRQVNDYVAETFGSNISDKQLLMSILVLQEPVTNNAPGQ